MILIISIKYGLSLEKFDMENESFISFWWNLHPTFVFTVSHPAILLLQPSFQPNRLQNYQKQKVLILLSHSDNKSFVNNVCICLSSHVKFCRCNNYTKLHFPNFLFGQIGPMRESASLSARTFLGTEKCEATLQRKVACALGLFNIYLGTAWHDDMVRDTKNVYM